MKPYINEVPKSRSYINEFRGYNHNLIISENEIYDGYNLTSDEYPVLSTRKPRGALTGYSNVLGMLGGEKLAVVGVKNEVFGFYYDGELCNIGLTLSDKTTPRQLVRAGSRIYVFPDGTSYDILTGEGGKEDAEKYYGPKFLKEYTLSYCEIMWSDRVAVNVDIDGQNYDYGLVEGGGAGNIVDKNGYKHKLYVKISIPDDSVSVFADGTIDNEYAMKKLGAFINFYEDDKTGEVGSFHKLDGGACYAVQGFIIGNHNKVQLKEDGACLYQGYSGDTFTYVGPAGEKDNSLKINGLVPPPLMDFVVECQNRLWGCRRGKDIDGNEVNAIYCTKLGNLYDWYTRDGLADSASEISVGTPGRFTGAITLSQNPIFFKENAAHKVYVSAAGAHQVYTLDVRGVQEGSHGSLAVVNESVIYKGVRDVLGFDGTNVTPLSDALGDVRYYNAVAGADGDKYVMYCEERVPNALPRRNIFTLDTKRGLWHRELIDCPVYAMTVYDHKLYMGTQDGILIHESALGEANEGNVKYMLESGEIGFETPDAKTLCRLDFRVKLALGTSFNVWLQYDSDGAWVEAVRYKGTLATPKSETVYVLPRRCDHFKYKITGSGDMKLYSISKVYERSEG